ncbi:hypothetical protein GCM10027284_46480 [Cyclobacterium sediminis]
MNGFYYFQEWKIKHQNPELYEKVPMPVWPNFYMQFHHFCSICDRAGNKKTLYGQVAMDG